MDQNQGNFLKIIKIAFCSVFLVNLHTFGAIFVMVQFLLIFDAKKSPQKLAKKLRKFSKFGDDLFIPKKCQF